MSRERPGRLPSLRGPRDLTLGGVRKKTFTPNIPVRKDRNKTEQKTKQLSDNNSAEGSKRKRDDVRRERQRGRGRGRGRGRPEIIQSHSIFEAGPSAEHIVKRGDVGHGTGGGGGGGGVTKDAIEKPSIKHEIFDEDLEKSKTEEALRNLEGNSNFIADLESDDTLLPTCLPMGTSSWPPGTVKESKWAKNSDANTSDIECSSIFQNYEMKQESSDSTNVLIFQLPDTLPIVPPSSEADIQNESAIKIKKEHGGPMVKQEPGTEQEANPDHCTLDQLSEGYVGKLQIMKSGRCRMIMGGIVLDVNAGTPTSFLEELAAVHLPLDDQESAAAGDIAVLGNVSHKIICTPDMEHLICQSKYETSR